MKVIIGIRGGGVLESMIDKDFAIDKLWQQVEYAKTDFVAFRNALVCRSDIVFVRVISEEEEKQESDADAKLL